MNSTTYGQSKREPYTSVLFKDITAPFAIKFIPPLRNLFIYYTEYNYIMMLLKIQCI